MGGLPAGRVSSATNVCVHYEGPRLRFISALNWNVLRSSWVRSYQLHESHWCYCLGLRALHGFVDRSATFTYDDSRDVI